MVSWTALGGDPVPGDVAAVDRIAATFGDVRDEADVISNRLQGLREGTGTTIWRGEAADAFRDLMAKLGPDLVKLSDSYHQAQEAMRGYSLSLSDAQYTARQAESNAESAITVRDDASRRARSAATEAGVADSQVRAAQLRLTAGAATQAAAGVALDPTYAAQLQQYMHDVGLQKNNAQAQSTAARRREGAARSEANAAAARLEAARRLAEQAKSLRDNAVRTAVQGLHAASQAGIHNRGFLMRTITEINHRLNDITASPEWARWMNIISDVGGILSTLGTVCTFIPFLQGAAGVLLALGAIFKGVAFLGTGLAALYGHASASQVIGRGADFAMSLLGVRAAAGLGKSGEVGKLTGGLKRAIWYDDARKATGDWRTIAAAEKLSGRSLTVATKFGIDPASAFRVKTGVDAVLLGKKAYDAGHEGAEGWQRLQADWSNHDHPELQHTAGEELPKLGSELVGEGVGDVGDSLKLRGLGGTPGDLVSQGADYLTGRLTT